MLGDAQVAAVVVQVFAVVPGQFVDHELLLLNSRVAFNRGRSHFREVGGELLATILHEVLA